MTLSLGALCSVVGIILLAMILLMIAKRRFRRNKPFALTARVVACVFVQFFAILVLTLVTHDPGPDAYTVDVEELLGHDARDALYIFVIVLLDIASIAVISFFKSGWVEPILR
jgi:uncharacterized membrane protein YozB (DUF420 family)